ncbi:MAG TPA: hypothetical protein VH044_02455 [Polyangiaceae bacterium]|jgi:hypothetical protein|nr:hypothetical protein [Polyangiaceae bacterium]
MKSRATAFPRGIRPTSSAVSQLASAARNAALVATAVLALVGLLAGAVRVLPWLLDPAVPWRVAQPFARGLAAVAIEAALLVGWPVGWALACFRFVERGEARVLQTLGQPPVETVARLLPRGAPLALALAAVALVYGSDASAPGRVVSDLIGQGQASCESATSPATYAIPFTDLTWLCAPGRQPRVVGSGPGQMASVTLSASSARIAGDFRALELDDARVLLPSETPVLVHVGRLSMHGMAPFARASTLSAPARALVLGLTAWLTASVAAYVTLRRGAGTRAWALVLGASGPIAALGLVRLLETSDARPALFALVPVAGAAAALFAAVAARPVRRALSVLSRWASRLRGRRRAARNPA